MLSKWDVRFLELAEHVSFWSKDPSTKVGAVITTPDNRIVSLGFNGFPQGVEDTAERYADREIKYKLIVHAERNAILFAKRDITGFTLYTFPFPPCTTCAGLAIQAGIKRVVAPAGTREQYERWGAEWDLACSMFSEAGIEMCFGTPIDKLHQWSE